jgi:lysophospholipase L1-like esterase
MDMSRARRVAAAAAYGGGGLGLAGVLGAVLLLGQARLARSAIGLAEAPPPRCDGRYGTEYPGEPVRLVVLGDSSAAGFGVHRARETPGALLATGLAEHLHRPVDLRCLAVVGATSDGLVPQRELALAWRADVAVILIGANDVTHRIRVSYAVGHLAATVRLLRDAGTRVVVGTCPDLGTIRPIQPPLRWLARQWSRDMAAAQTIAVVEAGGASVSLGDLLGPEFAASPDTMFSDDRFHPSAAGYLAAVTALLPTVLAAAGAPAEPEPVAERGEGVRSLARAAVEAVDEAGTEVSAAKVGGQDRGPAGRWADLRHRLRPRIEQPQDPVGGGDVTDDAIPSAEEAT